MGCEFEIVYSPDGSQLADATTIGIWLYDTSTLREVSASHRERETRRKQSVRSGWGHSPHATAAESIFGMSTAANRWVQSPDFLSARVAMRLTRREV